MSTKLCQEYLVKNFASWADERYGDETKTYPDADLRKECKRIVANAHKPSGWKRVSKYKVGSKTDIEGTENERTGMNYVDSFPHLVGWTCRVFYLKESDYIEIALFEKDGVIAEDYDDLSD